MVAKKYFEEQEYNVESYYYLVGNRNKRENMPGFMKICEIFGEPQVRLLIDEAENVFGLLVKRSPLAIRIYSFIIKAGKTDFLLKLRKTTI